jgi:hypothetical protein
VSLLRVGNLGFRDGLYPSALTLKITDGDGIAMPSRVLIA